MAIKAHLDPCAAAGRPDSSQRSTARRALRLETSVFAGAGAQDEFAEANVTIHNISAAGLLIETALELVEGETLAIDLPEAGVVDAMVVWRSERLYGCAFEVPIGAAALAAAQLQGFAPGVPTSPVRATAGLTGAGHGAGETLGHRINRLRREAGLTLADIAGALGVSKPTVWAWEKGKAKPLPERLIAIATALGVEADVLAPPTGVSREIDAVTAECRQRLAEVYGVAPQAVRIMIEL